MVVRRGWPTASVPSDQAHQDGHKPGRAERGNTIKCMDAPWRSKRLCALPSGSEHQVRRGARFPARPILLRPLPLRSSCLFFLRVFYVFSVMATHFDRRSDMRVPGAHARRGANFVRSVSATPTAGTVGIETAAPAIAARDDRLTKGEKAGVVIGVVLLFTIIGT